MKHADAICWSIGKFEFFENILSVIVAILEVIILSLWCLIKLFFAICWLIKINLQSIMWQRSEADFYRDITSVTFVCSLRDAILNDYLPKS